MCLLVLIGLGLKNLIIIAFCRHNFVPRTVLPVTNWLTATTVAPWESKGDGLVSPILEGDGQPHVVNK